MSGPWSSPVSARRSGRKSGLPLRPVSAPSAPVSAFQTPSFQARPPAISAARARNGRSSSAAVVIAGEETELAKRTHGPRVLDTRSTFYRHTERVMGWDIVNTGFRIVLSPEVPKVVEENLLGNVEGFLADNGLKREDISSYIFHSGGPKVLEAMQKSLGLPEDALAPSWKSLREVGNLSAASVLAVMESYLKEHPGKPGTYSILAAMGPAFCSELVLLQW